MSNDIGLNQAGFFNQIKSNITIWLNWVDQPKNSCDGWIKSNNLDSVMSSHIYLFQADFSFACYSS